MRLITALVDEYELKRFFTLTLADEFYQDDPWTEIRHPWSRFRHRMKRRFDSEWKFVAVLERHKNRDFPHIHGFCNRWMDYRDWSRIWEECRGGKIVWIERVADDGLSEYVSKQIEVARYVGKENLTGAYKHRKNLHTLWRSKGLKAKYELTTSTGWDIIKEPVYKENGELTDFYSKKGVWDYGPKKQPWEDLEGTRGSLSQESTENGIENMETEKPAGEHGESKEASRAT